MTNPYLEALATSGIKAKKSLGQNWLINPVAYEKIINALAVGPGELVLEVGPGLGWLTDQLIKMGARVVAVEKDEKLAKQLVDKYQDHKDVKIVTEDIRQFVPSAHGLAAGEFRVVGNIPYYLSSHLIRILLEEWPTVKTIVLLLPEAVAERLAARPPQMSPERGREGAQRASASYGMSLLGLSAQYYSQVELVAKVSRGSFRPIPKVDSAIVKLTPTGQRTDKNFNTKLFTIAHAAFGNKRKQLVTSLSANLSLPPSTSLGTRRNTIITTLAQCQISPQARPESLTVSDWERLASHLSLD